MAAINLRSIVSLMHRHGLEAFGMCKRDVRSIIRFQLSLPAKPVPGLPGIPIAESRRRRGRLTLTSSGESANPGIERGPLSREKQMRPVCE
jgi:hypothetical protein